MPTRRSSNEALNLCVTMTRWNLGVLLSLSVAFGSALAVLYTKVSDIDHKVKTLVTSLGASSNEVPHEPMGGNPVRRTVAADAAYAAEVDSLDGGSGGRQGPGEGSTPREEDRRDGGN